MSQTSPQRIGYFLANDGEIDLGYSCLGQIKEENVFTMKNKRALERLMEERWPKLRQKAQYEKNPEKLIAILEEIDDLLFSVEMRIAAQSGRRQARDGTNSRSDRLGSGALPSEDPEIGNP
jgi:hypothetical protein